MGKVINSTFVSLDGIINHMQAWHFDYIDEEHNQIAEEQLLAAEALLMGRKTYEVYVSAWP
jgi:dihydrofolate reductase